MAYNQFKLSGFPELAFKKSLQPLYDWFAQRDGYVTSAGISIAPVSDTLTTGASPVAITLAAYGTVITTGGTEGTESISALPDGEYAGQRKLLTVGTRTHASDVVSIDMTKVEETLIAPGTGGGATALTLDAADDYVLLEWTGAKWNILYHNGTLTT